jgi:hypothetical protein
MRSDLSSLVRALTLEVHHSVSSQSLKSNVAEILADLCVVDQEADLAEMAVEAHLDEAAHREITTKEDEVAEVIKEDDKVAAAAAPTKVKGERIAIPITRVDKVAAAVDEVMRVETLVEGDTKEETLAAEGLRVEAPIGTVETETIHEATTITRATMDGK